MNKEKLDQILEKYKAQPVGWGYIDIIVMRENAQDFIREVIAQDIRIGGISWWAYYPRMDMNLELGLGGPISLFYPGWFSEIYVSDGFDSIEEKFLSKREEEKNIMRIIENKVVTLGVTKFHYKEQKALTPAFWLDVPKDWRNVVE